MHGHGFLGAFGSWLSVGFDVFFFSGIERCWQHVRTGLDFADSSDATLGSVSRSKVQQHQAGPASVAIIRYAIKPTRIMTSPKGPSPNKARVFIFYYRSRSKENQCEQPEGYLAQAAVGVVSPTVLLRRFDRGNQCPLRATGRTVSCPAVEMNLDKPGTDQHFTERPLPDGSRHSVRPGAFPCQLVLGDVRLKEDVGHLQSAAGFQDA